MIKKLQSIVSGETNPYRNIALEEYLLRHVEPESCILYLWQNRKTVVIGRNQNCFKECRVEELERDGGFLARRLSGGGAVFHDMGNLNFTFLVPEDGYDVDRQLSVILKACRLLGIPAEKTGRNDITVEGRKFSGNAFYKSDGRCYHHGTLMLLVDLENVSRYLNVSADKLKAKGVSSVKSRVTNLSEFCPGLTVSLMIEKMVEAFEDVYGLPAQKMDKREFPQDELEERYRFFSSPSWKYGSRIPFTYESSRRFAWGDAQLLLEVKEGTIKNAALFSDAMDETFLLSVPKALVGCHFGEEPVKERLFAMKAEGEEQRQIIADIAALICM